jgi:hypothetical protein
MGVGMLWLTPEHALQLAFVVFLAMALLAVFATAERTWRLGRPEPEKAARRVAGPRRKIPISFISGSPPEGLSKHRPLQQKKRKGPDQPDVSKDSDDPSGADEDVPQETPPEQVEQVEFCVLAPSYVGPFQTFSIVVAINKESEISSEKESPTSQSGVTSRAFKTLITEIPKGTPICVALESKRLVIDVPEQVIRWDARELAAVFNVRYCDTAIDDIVCKVLIKLAPAFLAWRIYVGNIEFSIRVRRSYLNRFARRLVQRPSEKLPAAKFNQRIGDAMLNGQGKHATRCCKIFLCHSDRDRPHVMRLAEGMWWAGIEPHFDKLSFTAGLHWKIQARGVIEDCDALYLCWSKNAAGEDGNGTPGIKIELEHALELERGSKPGFAIIPVLVGDAFIELPEPIRGRWVEQQYLAFRKEWETRYSDQLHQEFRKSFPGWD